MTPTGKNRIMIYGAERRRDLRYRIQNGRGRGASDLDPEDGDCGDPAFSRANAVWIVRAGCERLLIKEVGRLC